MLPFLYAYFQVKGMLGRKELAHNISTFSTEEQKVCYIYDLLGDLNIVRNCTYSSLYKKSASESVTFRLKGNSMFQQQQYGEALTHYTKSIANSPFPSEYPIDVRSFLPPLGLHEFASNNELVYAFGNRSAVLYAMGQYDLCLKDIERAQALNCPTGLVQKLLKRKANCLMLKDQENGVLQSCEHYMAQLSLDTVPVEIKTEITAALHETEKKINDPNKSYSTTDKAKQKQLSFFKDLKVSYGPHEKIQCASKCIDVGYYETMGRGLVATRDIAVGDVLLIEDPFGGSLYYDNHYSYCNHCFMFCYALIPCYRCSVAMFCSEACRKESWVQYHYVECYVITCNDFCQQDVPKIALRIAVTASSQHNSLVDFCSWVKLIKEDVKNNSFDMKECCYDTDYRGVYHMISNTEKMSERDSCVKTLTAVCLTEFLQAETKYFCNVPEEKVRETKKFVATLLLRHMNIVSCNIHQIAEYRKSGPIEFTKHGVAVALYPVHGLLNHSCSPNVVRVSYKGKMVLFARRPIQQGQQIFDCYKNYYTLHNIEERRQHLEEIYFFQCKCEACVEKWPTYDYLPAHLTTFRCQNCGAKLLKEQHMKHIVCCKQCKTTNDIAKITNHIVSSLKMANKYLESTTPERDAFGAYIELPDPLICLRVMASLLQDWEMYIQPTWKEYDLVQESFSMALDQLSSLSLYVV